MRDKGSKQERKRNISSIPSNLDQFRRGLKCLKYLGKENTEQGITLIELLVVLFIIGILSAVAIPIYLGYVNKAKSCRNYLCIGLDPVEAGCATNIGTIKSTVFEETTIELRYSAKCDTSWSRSTAPPGSISGSTLYVEDTQGNIYGQYNIPEDRETKHFSNMGPGKELKACVQSPNGEIACTELID